MYVLFFIFSGCSDLDLNSRIDESLLELANLNISKPDSKLDVGYLTVKTKEAVYGFADASYPE